MISLNIEEVKPFMAMLLTNTLFDDLILKEMEIQTFTGFSVSGHFYENFFSKEELEERGADKAVLWSEIRRIAFSVIRGSKPPLAMKIVFQLPKNLTDKLVDSLGGKLRTEDVGGLYLNIRFENNELRIITGTAIKTFTMDKTLDIEWDGWVKRFLGSKGIIFEEI
jgi:hypothetical protein